MTDKFKNKYRIPSARLANWDYGSNAPYFVTICTANREHFFGHIIDGKMQLSDIGQIAHEFWMKIPDHFPFVTLDAFVVMPNHVHGIIVIEKSENVLGGEKNGDETDGDGDDGDNVDGDDGGGDGDGVETPNLGVSTTTMTTTTNVPTHPQTAAASQKWKPQTLGVIINQYKRIVTINARKINPNYAWQSRFHDHVIRNAKSFNTISNYIVNNPLNWKEDRFNRIQKH